MSKAIQNLMAAQQNALKIRPKVGGFPYLAEVLKMAGVTKNTWTLPSCQSVFNTSDGPVVMTGKPLINEAADVPKFDKDALVQALRTDQKGNSTFPEFLTAAWESGVIRYEVDFIKRTVAYFGINDECYIEDYPEVTIDGGNFNTV